MVNYAINPSAVIQLVTIGNQFKNASVFYYFRLNSRATVIKLLQQSNPEKNFLLYFSAPKQRQ